MNSILIIGAVILAVFLIFKIVGRIVTIVVVLVITAIVVFYFSSGHTLSDLGLPSFHICRECE